MSNRLFSVRETMRLQRKARHIYKHTRNLPFLVKLEWRERRHRTWGRTVLGFGVGLALAALAGWLWHLVKHAALGPVVRLPGLAVMPWLQGLVWGLLTFGSVAVLWTVALWIKRRDDEAMARWSVAEKVDPEGSTSATPYEDPLALPAVGMTRDELRRIIAAMIAEATEARGLIESEMDGLGVETWEERLARAQRCMHGVILCLGNLADRISEPVLPAKPVVQIRMDSDAFRESLERNKSQIAAFVSMVAVRAQSLRAYHSPASGYRPNHGGYGA